MAEGKHFLQGLRYPENVDCYCSRLLAELARVSGEEFYDPGLEHLWFEEHTYEERVTGVDIFVSDDFYEKLKDLGLTSWEYDGVWKRLS